MGKYAILAASLLMIVASFAIGYWGKKKADTAQAYFGATGIFGPFATGLSTLGGIVSAFALVGVNGLVYNTGTGMGLWMLTAVSGPFGLMCLAKKVRAVQEIAPLSSLGDVTDVIYNNSRIIKGVMSGILALGCLAYLTSQISAGINLFTYLLNWPPLLSGLLIFGILAVYMTFSGEVGGVMTQVFQGVIMVIACIALIISFFVITGGFGGVIEAVSKVSSVTSSDGSITKEFTPDMLNAFGTAAKASCFAWIFIPIVGSIGQPQSVTRMYAIKDPLDIPKTALWFGVTHVIVGFASVVIGYGCLYLVATGRMEPLAAYDSAIFAWGEYAGPFVQLCVYIAVLAASMSSASIYLSVSATALSRDLPHALGMNLTDKKQLRISKISMLVIGVVAVFFTLYAKEGVAILGTFGWGTLMTATMPTVMLGMFWPKASRRGVEIGEVTALVLNILSLSVIKWPGSLPWYYNVFAITMLVSVACSLIFPDAKGANRFEKQLEIARDL